MVVSISRTQPLSHLVILWLINNLYWQASQRIGSIWERKAEGIKAQGKICPAKQETALINKQPKKAVTKIVERALDIDEDPSSK